MDTVAAPASTKKRHFRRAVTSRYCVLRRPDSVTKHAASPWEFDSDGEELGKRQFRVGAYIPFAIALRSAQPQPSGPQRS